jgi:hypothetical protein
MYFELLLGFWLDLNTALSVLSCCAIRVLLAGKEVSNEAIALSLTSLRTQGEVIKVGSTYLRAD